MRWGPSNDHQRKHQKRVFAVITSMLFLCYFLYFSSSSVPHSFRSFRTFFFSISHSYFFRLLFFQPGLFFCYILFSFLLFRVSFHPTYLFLCFFNFQNPPFPLLFLTFCKTFLFHFLYPPPSLPNILICSLISPGS